MGKGLDMLKPSISQEGIRNRGRSACFADKSGACVFADEGGTNTPPVALAAWLVMSATVTQVPTAAVKRKTIRVTRDNKLRDGALLRCPVSMIRPFLPFRRLHPPLQLSKQQRMRGVTQ